MKPGQGGAPDAVEWASRDEIEALQLQRLQSTLKRVYDHVPAMRAKFDGCGAHPSEVKSLADLARFPFTTKADLRDNYPFGLFAVPREKIVRLHASSGTTGKPTVVGYTQADIDTVGRPDGALAAHGGRAARHDRPCRLWLRPVHRRPRRALRRRAARLHRGSGFRRHDRAAGAIDPRISSPTRSW